ncbi:MAG: hypothetical protein HUK28_06070 [Methanobrevibacter sp.]|nr:hypothetical protein [Methanobrevibacter sp.]
MITITKNEEIVLNQIKIFTLEYSEGIPLDVLKEDTGFYEYNLVEILKSLDEKELIDFKDNKVNLLDIEKEINTVKSKKDLEELELSIKEQESYNIIKDIVDENNMISKYILEGNLLYGNLKLSNFSMFHIILSLQNKGILKPIKKDDGEYYMLVS